MVFAFLPLGESKCQINLSMGQRRDVPVSPLFYVHRVDSCLICVL